MPLSGVSLKKKKEEEQEEKNKHCLLNLFNYSSY